MGEDAPELVSSAQGNGSLFETYARHFLRFFQTTEHMCDEVAIEQYKEHRLRQVQATTVRGELSALRRLHRWMRNRCIYWRKLGQ